LNPFQWIVINEIIPGAGMAGLVMYVWLFEDFLIGLLLAVMMAPPIAMFAWMLKLRGGALRYISSASSIATSRSGGWKPAESRRLTPSLSALIARSISRVS
jgi:hypothetical protein